MYEISKLYYFILLFYHYFTFGNRQHVCFFKKKILIINSYHPTFTWTQQVIDGIRNMIEKSGIKKDVYVEFLDAKRFPKERNIQNFKSYIAKKYKKLNFDIIITSDNAALEISLELQKSIFKEIPIVFCGYNGDAKKIIGPKNIVTGIIEKWNPLGTLKLIKKIQPKVSRLYLIHDNTGSGLSTLEDFTRSFISSNYSYLLTKSTNKSMPDILSEISKLESNSSVILLGYNRDTGGRIYNSIESANLFGMASSVPVYTIDESRFTDKIMGGDMLSGYSQGREAAKVALEILLDKSISNYPISSVPIKNLKINYTQLKKYNIGTSTIPSHAVVVNRPRSLYDDYAREITIIGIFTLFMTLLSIVLIITLIRKNRLESENRNVISTLNESVDIFIIFNSDLDTVFINSSGCSFFNLEKGTHYFKVSNFLPDFLIDEITSSRETCSGNTSKTIWNNEIQILDKKSAGKKVFLATILMHCSKNIKNIYYSVVLRDVTSLKKLNHILQNNIQNLKITINSIGDSVIITDELGIVMRVNPATLEITEYNISETIGDMIYDIIKIHKDDYKATEVDIFSEIKNSDSLILHSQGFHYLITKNGIKSISYTSSKIISQKNEILGYVFILKDVTEEMELQNRLRQSQKMEAIGQLAGGISHDFNNILTVVMGNAQLINTYTDIDSEVLELSSQIYETSKKAKGVINQLLIFSRNDKVRTEPVSIHAVISETVKLISRTLDKRITIETKLESDDSLVLGDSAMYQNCMLNLFINARDSMADKGKISVTTRNKVIEKNNDNYTNLKEGKYIEVSITDTGKGMDCKTQKQIFNPYFTTKPPGQGTGLGLTMVFGTVERFGGNISVESEINRGTTFRILLPHENQGS